MVRVLCVRILHAVQSHRNPVNRPGWSVARGNIFEWPLTGSLVPVRRRQLWAGKSLIVPMTAVIGVIRPGRAVEQVKVHPSLTLVTVRYRVSESD
jgi:hypothetical protein